MIQHRLALCLRQLPTGEACLHDALRGVKGQGPCRRRPPSADGRIRTRLSRNLRFRRNSSPRPKEPDSSPTPKHNGNNPHIDTTIRLCYDKKRRRICLRQNCTSHLKASSGQGENPYRRYSPRTDDGDKGRSPPTRCDSGADSYSLDERRKRHRARIPYGRTAAAPLERICFRGLCAF